MGCTLTHEEGWLGLVGICYTTAHFTFSSLPRNMACTINLYTSIVILDYVTGWIEAFHCDADLPGGYQVLDVHCHYNVFSEEQWGIYMFY